MNSIPSLLTTFDRVVVINLARRAERMARFNQLFANWPFKPPQRFEAIDGTQAPMPKEWDKGPGAWGCMLSHRAVLSSAIADNVSSLFVLEDDACPVPNFAALAADFLAHVPSDWDCLMFGAQHLSPPIPITPAPGTPEPSSLPSSKSQIPNPRSEILNSPIVVQCTLANRTHAFALRGNMMPTLLALWNQFNTDHCDILLASLMPRFKVYAPKPFLIGQDAGFSDVTGRDEPRRFIPTKPSINLSAAKPKAPTSDAA